MADHQHETIACRDVYQFLTLRRARRHRLFDEGVLAREQARLSQVIMMLNGRGDDYCIQIHAVEEMLEAR